MKSPAVNGNKLQKIKSVKTVVHWPTDRPIYDDNRVSVIFIFVSSCSSQSARGPCNSCGLQSSWKWFIASLCLFCPERCHLDRTFFVSQFPAAVRPLRNRRELVKWSRCVWHQDTIILHSENYVQQRSIYCSVWLQQGSPRARATALLWNDLCETHSWIGDPAGRGQ